MTILKLTKRSIDAIKPCEKEMFYWDTEMQGFGLVVYPSGKKSFILQYRNKLGRGHRKVLGRYGIETVDDVRTIARQHWSDISKGGDPVDEERTRRNSATMNELFDMHIERHVKVHNAATTIKTVIPQIDKHLRPALGALKVHAVTRQDVQKLHVAMKATPRNANKQLAILSKVFSNAELWGLRAENSNPCRKIKQYPQNSRERFLSDVEVKRLGDAIREAESEGLPWLIAVEGDKAKHLAKPENRRSPIAPDVLKIILLLIFTGARRGEIVSLEWEHVDFDRGLVSLPKTKGTARRAHPVSVQALEILAGIRRIDGARWVFSRSTDKSRHVAPEVVENAWQRLRKRAGIEDVHLHDLRHTFATFGSQAGANAHILRDALRHSSTAMTSRYVNYDESPVRVFSDAIGGRIAAGLGSVLSAKVIELRPVKNEPKGG